MTVSEPTLEQLAHPCARYLAATRPGFLGMTAAGAILGVACAYAAGVSVDAASAVVTLIFALVAHAAANVLNDYHDARNGSDAANLDRQFPYTGGSRLIQNGVLDEDAMARYGYALLASVIPAGLWLSWHSDGVLLLVGVAGLLIAWAYSAPPFALMCRGLGEFAVGAGWLLVVIGADLVQRGALAALPFAAGLGFALHVMVVLLVNEFPDIAADTRAGKRNLVVRLGPARARALPPALYGVAYCWLVVMVVSGELPVQALLALLALVPATRAVRALWRDAARPAALVPAIVGAITAALLHAALLALGLTLAGWSS